MSSLTPDQVALQLDGLPNWQLDGNSLVTTFEFDDFAAAVAFIVRASFHCQALEHYPLWQQNYNTISIRIGLAEQAAVQSRDVQLAKRLQSSLS